MESEKNMPRQARGHGMDRTMLSGEAIA